MNTNDFNNDCNALKIFEGISKRYNLTSFALIRLEKYDEALNLLNIASALNNNPNTTKRDSGYKWDKNVTTHR